jgi:hypothetical protein
VYGKNDHATLDLVENIGETQILIARMDVTNTITDLDLGRKDKRGKKEIEPDAQLGSVIVLFYLQ